MNPALHKKAPKLENWNFAEQLAFAAFAIWSALGLGFTVAHITPLTIGQWNLPQPATDFIRTCLVNGDPILILLAFMNTHLHAARQWTSMVARGWGLFIILAAFGVEALGSHTGYPFGDYTYTDNFGPRIFLVPITIPLAWHVVVTNALFIVRAVAPHVSRIAEALIAGTICTAYDFILEPFATDVKSYWIWTDHSVPPLNYAAWFAISALMIFHFAPTYSLRFRRDPRPWLILLFTLAIFLAGEFA